MQASIFDIEQYYFNVTSFNAYDYQKDVFKALLEGKNIILNVPTGAGKTWASILPFIYAKEKGIDFPQKLIYSLPLRTLVNSIHEDIINNEYIKGRFPNIAKQTGEYDNDPTFEEDIIFSTIDQTLSSFLCFPLSLSARKANINAGALIGSYLIFDEFHLLEADLAMATTIGCLKKLGILCRCCIMTATLSENFKNELKKNLSNYEIISLDNYLADKEKVKSLLPKENKKTITVVKNKNTIQQLHVTDIIAHHLPGRKTIVICNRVEKTQKIFIDLKEAQKNGNIKDATIICLHSRFFEEDRKTIEQKLKTLFGKDSKANAILVATQVIEAGLDITCDVMHVEISPIDSFLQRVGRNARFEGEKGKIFIYGVLEVIDFDEEGISEFERQKVKSKYRQYLPYPADICEKTLEELQNYNTLDGEIPKHLIEKILSEQDKNIMNRLASGECGGFNQKKINDSWNECLKSNYRNTIRDIQSTELILMLPKDEQYILQFPYSYQSISLFRFSFQKKFKDLQNEITDHDEWIAKELVENNIIDFDMGNQQQLKFCKVTNPERIPQRVYINANYFKYDKEFGLNLIQGISKSSPEKIKKVKASEEERGLTKDTFVAHNLGLYNCYLTEFKPRLGYSFKIINQLLSLSLSEEEFDELFKLVFAYHDLGKLNKGWQKPMREYQAYKDGGKPLKEFIEILAHTDFDKTLKDDIELSKHFKLHNRPPHAEIGALVIQDVLNLRYKTEYLASAISFAIARHHSAGSMEIGCSSYTIPPKYYKAFQELIQKMHLNVAKPNLQMSNRVRIEVEKEDKVWLIYFFFVRILRICDQKATIELNNYLP